MPFHFREGISFYCMNALSPKRLCSLSYQSSQLSHMRIHDAGDGDEDIDAYDFDSTCVDVLEARMRQRSDEPDRIV